MSNPGDADSTPITSLKQLADHIAAGCKPPQLFRIGTEHEKFGFRLADLAAPPYEPTDGQPGSIRGLLEAIRDRFGGVPITDTGRVIGLKQGDAAISLEEKPQRPRSSHAGSSSRDARTWAMTLSSQDRCQASSGESGPVPTAIPALEQKMSISPRWPRAAAMSSRTPFSVATSPGTA